MPPLNRIDRMKPHPGPKPHRKVAIRTATPPPIGPEPAAYKLSEAAWMLRVTPQWFGEQLRKAKLPGSKFAGEWRVTRADIDKALQMHHMPAVNGRNPFGMTDRSWRNLQRRMSLEHRR